MEVQRTANQEPFVKFSSVPLVDFQLRAGHFGHAAKADIDVKSLSDKSGPHAAINPLWVNPGVWN